MIDGTCFIYKIDKDDVKMTGIRGKFGEKRRGGNNMGKYIIWIFFMNIKI